MSEGGRATPAETRQDLYSGSAIAWRWVFVGALIVLGLEALVSSVLVAVGLPANSFGTLVAAMVLAFLGGGAVIGWLSPGWTAWEGGFASALAVILSVFFAVEVIDIDRGFIAALPIGLAIGVLCGLAGGWIGERLQHRA